MIKPVVPYNPEWETEFNQLKSVLNKLLQGVDADIQHVGSTAVPGAVAKPLLDIDIIIESRQQLPVVTEKLLSAGYIAKGEQGVPDRFAFRQSNEQSSALIPGKKWMRHHLYVCLRHSLAAKNHLLLRDLLRRRPDLVEQYSRLKLDLVKMPGITSEEYSKRKTDFIITLLAQAGLTETELQEITRANS